MTIVFIVISLSCSDNKPNKINFYNTAEYYYNKHNYVEAINYCKKALAIDSLYSDAILLKVQANLYLHNTKGLLKDINILLRLDGKSDALYLLRGQYYFDSKNFAKAIVDLKKSVDLDSTESTSLSLLGECYSSIGKNDSALYFYDKAVELNPNDSSVYYQRGTFYLITGKVSKAYDDFVYSIKLNPNYSIPHYSLGILEYTWLKKHEEGCAEMKKAIELGFKGDTSFYHEKCKIK